MATKNPADDQELVTKKANRVAKQTAKPTTKKAIRFETIVSDTVLLPAPSTQEDLNDILVGFTPDQRGAIKDFITSAAFVRDGYSRAVKFTKMWFTRQPKTTTLR